MRIIVSSLGGWKATVEAQKVCFNFPGAIYFVNEVPEIVLFKGDHAILDDSGVYNPILTITRED